MPASSNEFEASLVALIPKIRRFCYALTGAMADADDLLQATLERALKKRHLFMAGTELERWLYGLGRNLWIDLMRQKKTRGENIELDEEHAPGIDSESALHAEITLKKVSTAMQALNPEHRSVLALIAVDGLSYSEAAEVLDVPIGTVMSRLARARACLLDTIEQKLQ